MNRIQKIRKDNGYELTDRIQVKLGDAGSLAESIRLFAPYIKAEVLADELEMVDDLTDGMAIEVNEKAVKVWVDKTPQA